LFVFYFSMEKIESFASKVAHQSELWKRILAIRYGWRKHYMASNANYENTADVSF
jgi:hypothetical protein